MTITELIEKHVEFMPDSNRHAIKQFAIELLETVKEKAPLEVRQDPYGTYVGMMEGHRQYGFVIDKALEELKK